MITKFTYRKDDGEETHRTIIVNNKSYFYIDGYDISDFDNLQSLEEYLNHHYRKFKQSNIVEKTFEYNIIYELNDIILKVQELYASNLLDNKIILNILELLEQLKENTNNL